MSKLKPCKDCTAPVMWWQTPSGNWQLYEPVPIPFLRDSQGVVVNRGRLVDAGTAWPEPPEMLPRHRCPAAEMTAALAPVGDALAHWLDEWGPLAFPKPRRTAADRERWRA
jgi:hypothetical protein